MLNVVNLISKAHGHARVLCFDKFLEIALKTIEKTHLLGDWNQYREDYVSAYREFPASLKFIQDPTEFIKSMAIVLKSPDEDRKGVIVIAYNYAFPTFLLLFDIARIQERYHVVLEPSTARFLMPEILIFDHLNDPVYVQCGEPRDAEFLERFSSSLIGVPIAANWWVDDRVFYPDPTVAKMYDVIMVSSFSNLKRHWLLFKAMKELKDRGRVITAVLIGYAGSLTKKDLEHQATEYGVLEQVTILEDLTPAQVALYYNRSKLNLLLSKREGFNRSLIEGLYCNIPCFIRDGFNFDYKYPYISEKSGGYYTDTSLASDLSGWLDSYGSFRAKELVAAINMQADEAAKILSRAIFKEDGDCLVSKTSGLHGMEYWTEEEERKFDADYSYLLSCLIKQ